MLHLHLLRSKKGFAEFKHGYASLEDDPFTIVGAVKNATTPEVINKLQDIILPNLCLKVSKTAKTV